MAQPTELHPLVARTRQSLKQFGYRDELLIPNYGFSDVLGDHDEARTVPLAAFAQEPTSYKTARFGITLTQSNDPREIEYYRALGAPVVIAFREDTNSFHLWKMMAHGLPEARGEFPVDTLPEVLRARNIAFPSVSPQLDFYDVGLVPAIEADVHRKLSELLGEVIARAKEVYEERQSQEADYRSLFQLIFRFMAAKLLGDRKHEGGDWLNPDASAVLRAVNNFYNPPVTLPASAAVRNLVWEKIRGAFHFQNLSVEALAYVYENTFVDLETRRAYSTHATPYEVAEYMVRALPVETLPQHERTIFEPFCGAAPFLITALGRLRELLEDKDMDAKKRHDYFVRMLAGMEIDPFAREVAFHSLILADYPNSNGWKILEEDVFASSNLTDNLMRANVVLCNPPYSSFNAQERHDYSLSAANKAVEALLRVLQDPPKMLGFVLPHVYRNGQSYRQARQQLEVLYRNIDVIALPETVFQHSRLETVVLLAYGDANAVTRRRFVSLSDQEYRLFKTNRVIDWEKNPPERLWEELKGSAVLSSVADVHRGIEYNVPFKANYSRLVSDVEKPGFQPGLVRAQGGFQPFMVPDSKYLNTDESLMLYSAYRLPWQKPKVIAPAGRRSIDRWITAASADYDGLLCTQNFHGIWPKSSDLPLEIFVAVMNGPVASMWLFSQRTSRHNQVRSVQAIPLPKFTPTATELITRYVDRYVRFHGTAEAMDVLLKIDAGVLDAYGLSEEAEGELLAWFDGARRPGVPGFTGYGPAFEQARTEYRHELAHFQQVERYQALVDKTFLDGLTPQEAQEKDHLSRLIDEDSAPFHENSPQELSHGR